MAVEETEGHREDRGQQKGQRAVEEQKAFEETEGHREDRGDSKLALQPTALIEESALQPTALIDNCCSSQQRQFNGYCADSNVKH